MRLQGLQSIAMTDSEGNDLPRATIDYSRLSDSTLKEILSATTIEENETDH
jgi:hypothetical protein